MQEGNLIQMKISPFRTTYDERLLVYCDFDGTISLEDVTDQILTRLADPQWKKIEASWERGEIGSRECMSRQVPLIRGGWKAVEKVIADVELDPAFAPFSRWCTENEIPLVIVSDGLDRVINFLLKRDGIFPDAVWANHLNIAPDGNLFLSFPAPPIAKSCTSGLCKCGVLARHRTKARRIIIGDGLSDFCWAQHADVVFAKHKLLTHCREKRMPSVEFDSFASVHARLEAMLENLAHHSADDELEVAMLHDAFGEHLVI